MIVAIFSILLRLPYRPSTFPELIGQLAFAVIGLSFVLYIYVSIRFGSTKQTPAAPLAKTIPAPAIPKPAETAPTIIPPLKADTLSDEARMTGFLAKLNKEFYDSILGVDPARVEGLYKHDQRTTKWEEKFFRYLDQRKFKDGLFYDTQYVSFQYGLWQVTVLFHNKQAVRCAVIGVTWHFKPFLEKVLPAKEWTEEPTGRKWSFAMNEQQFWLTAHS